MINYESELSDKFLKELERLYNVADSVVFDYFYIRFLIEFNDKLIKNEDYVKKIVVFLIKELNLPCYEDKFLYKGETIHRGYGLENSLYNIVSNWLLQSSFQTKINDKGISLKQESFINKIYRNIFNYGKNKAQPFKGDKNYHFYFKYHALLFLNKQYQADVKVAVELEGIEYPPYHHFFIRTLEEVYSAYIHSSEYAVHHTKTIKEKDLELYLIKNLCVIEAGLRYINHQVSIKDGRLDILAKDKNNVFVILELKVQEDKELLWQCLYYPKAFMKQENVNHVRMITVAPEYPEHILTALKLLKHIEIIQFDPYVELGQIKSLEVKKL